MQELRHRPHGFEGPVHLLGLIEQLHHGVERLIGFAGSTTAPERIPAQALRPTGAPPHQLQDPRGLRVRCDPGGRLLQQRRQVGHGPCQIGLDGTQQVGISQTVRDQLCGGCGRAVRRRVAAQQSSEAGQSASVQSAQRRTQQVCGSLSRQATVDSGRRPQDVQERPDRGRECQRNVVARDLGRNAGGEQSPLQRRQVTAPGPYQHGHLGPVQAQFREHLRGAGPNPAQEIGDVVGLRRFRLVDTHRVVTTLRPQRGGPAVRLDRLRGDTRQRVVRNHPLREVGEYRPEPTCGLQRDGAAPGLGEDLVETQQAVGIRPPESVDRLIGITHCDHLCPMSGELLQELHLRRVGVLVLVHVDRSELQDIRRRALRDHHRGPSDQLGVVHEPGESHDVQILRVDRGGRGRHRIGSGQRLRRQTKGLGPCDVGAHLVGESTAGPGRLQLRGKVRRLAEDLAQHRLLLRSSHQAQAGIRRRQQPIRQRVESGGDGHGLATGCQALS